MNLLPWKGRCSLLAPWMKCASLGKPAQKWKYIKGCFRGKCKNQSMKPKNCKSMQHRRQSRDGETAHASLKSFPDGEVEGNNTFYFWCYINASAESTAVEHTTFSPHKCSGGSERLIFLTFSLKMGQICTSFIKHF